LIRKAEHQAPPGEAFQRQQKTPQKMKSEVGTEPLSTQNSDFPPLSQPETPDTVANDTVANDTVANDTQPTSREVSDAVPEADSNEADSKLRNRDQSKATSTPPAPRKIGLRIAIACIALVPLTLFIVAGNLNPAEQGLGTHQQLGLPPCSLRLLAGIRCPACGMTTSWSYFARGNWLASMNTNAGGFLLALLCVAMIVLAAQVVRCGRLPSPRVQTWLTLAGAGILVVTLVDWIVRLQFQAN